METKEIEFAQEKHSFSMTCRVKAQVHSNPDAIWSLLTDSKRFSKWNSTVTGIDGRIHEGERIRIHVPGTNRTFRPKISDMISNKQMIWSDGISPIFKGARRFELIPRGNGLTEFIMEEKFSGLLFAMMKNRLPDFRPIFERYALDLKIEAEKPTPFEIQ